MAHRFIADTMLGKLARWLSHLGYDIIYKPCDRDADLLKEAAATERTILTRDTRLVEEKPARAHLIHSTLLWEQLKEMLDAFPIDVKKTLFTRCSRCNTPVKRIEKSEVKDRLPPLVHQTQETIYQCPGCGHLYWPATHVDHIRQLLKEKLGIDLG